MASESVPHWIVGRAVGTRVKILIWRHDCSGNGAGLPAQIPQLSGSEGDGGKAGTGGMRQSLNSFVLSKLTAQLWSTTGAATQG